MKQLLGCIVLLLLLAGCDRQEDEMNANVRASEDSLRALRVASPDPVRPNEVLYFKAALAEYRRQDSLEAVARGVRNQERTHLRSWVSFKEMKYAYRNLNPTERQLLFADSTARFEEGARIDIGPPLTEIAGYKLASDGSAQENFEGFLQLSFMEIDYMSAFSLERADRDSTIVRYIRAAARRGLNRFNRPEDYVRQPIVTTN